MNRRHLVPLPAAFALLCLVACSIESPELPSYETEWLIPLGTTTRTVDELLGDQPSVVTQTDGSLALQTEGELDAVALGDRLDLDLSGTSTEAAIGTIDLPAAAPISFDYRLGDLYPAAESMAGVSIPVPPFTFENSSEPQDLPGFTEAAIASGGISVLVHNGLPVPVGGDSAPDQIHIDLLNAVDGSTLASLLVVGAIDPGQQAQEFLDLAGLTMPDSVAVRLAGGSPGSSGSPVLVDPDDSIAVEVQTTDLRVDSARAPIEAQSFVDSSSVELPDSIRVQSATIASGVLQAYLRNDLPVPVTATLSIDALQDASGQPFRLDLPVAAGGSASRSVDLSPYHFDFGAGLGQELVTRIEAVTPGSGGSSVWIQSTDVLSLDVAPIALSFASVRGVIDPIEVELASSTTELDLPDDLDDLELAHSELTLAIQSSLGMPAHLDLQLDGRNRDGTVVPLDVDVDLPAAPSGRRIVHNVVLDETNSTLLDFLNNLPTTIDVRGTASVGDGVTVGEVAVDDSVSARYSITAPMTVAILAQVVDLDAAAIDLDDDLRDEIQRRVVSLDLEAEIHSTLPIEARAWIGLDADSTAVHENPQLQLGPIEIPAAGNLRGDGTRPEAASESQVAVSAAQVPVITQPRLFQGVRVEIPGTSGNFVTVRADDYLEIRGFLRARLNVGDQ